MQSDRRERIRNFIDSRGEATVAQLLELCNGCSSMTLWRDLNALEQEGIIRRTRGGAISMRSLQPDTEGLYSLRARENPEQKRAIAGEALAFVQPGYAIYLDAGSTSMALAKQLEEQHYTIITSGANIAIELSRHRDSSITLVGGQINGSSLSCSGPQADQFIDGVNIDTAIMAASGFSLQGGFTSGVAGESALKRRVIGKASRVVMLMDSSKLNKSLPFTFCTLTELDVLITDAPLPEEVETAARLAGVAVRVAQGWQVRPE